MFAKDICIWEKFSSCKKGSSCHFHHPTLVCDDHECDIKMCLKRHPQACVYDTMFHACKNEDRCRYQHRKIEKSNDFNEETYRVLEEKYNAIVEDYKIVLQRIEALEKKKDECKKIYDDSKLYFTKIYNDTSIRGINQDKVINDLIAKIQFLETKQCNCTHDENLVTNHHEPMLHLSKDPKDSECSRKDGDIKRKLDSDEEDAIMSTAVEAPEKKIVIELAPLKKNRSLEDPSTVNNEYLNIKFLFDETSKIKDFVRKTKMVSKGVNECKEKLQKLKFEMRKRGANQSVERILIGMFNSLCEKVEKILYRNFKNDTKAEIDKFLDICQKEKVKYESKLNNMKME